MFFETSLEKKIDRIKTEYCDVFIDDLPSVLNHQNFPKQTIGILFGSRNSTMPNLISWNDSNWIFDLPEQQIQIKPIFYKSLPVDKHEKCFRKLLQFKTQSTIKVEAVVGGANNRAYKILTDEKIFMGKVFFRDKDDSRDRLFHEICFESYLGSLELNCYPKILKTDKNSGIAIYQWLNGKKFDAILEIKKKYWELCLQFIDKLQTNKNSEVAKKIPNSSESAFSLKEHLSILQSRHDYWLNFCINSNNNIPSSIKEFILGDLELYYQKLAKETLVHPNFDHLLCSEGRIVSPSDFGLHNTLIKDDDSLYFFDFEYAGWDDPAKTIADFFCQPRYPPPLELYPLFVETFLNFLPQKAHKPFIERLNIIYRIVSLKWCYIRLNGIHEIHNQRRKFANYSETDENSIIKYFKTILQNPVMNYLP